VALNVVFWLLFVALATGFAYSAESMWPLQYEYVLSGYVYSGAVVLGSLLAPGICALLLTALRVTQLPTGLQTCPLLLFVLSSLLLYCVPLPTVLSQLELLRATSHMPPIDLFVLQETFAVSVRHSASEYVLVILITLYLVALWRRFDRLSEDTIDQQQQQTTLVPTDEE
jgi:hypothetical protein